MIGGGSAIAPIRRRQKTKRPASKNQSIATPSLIRLVNPEVPPQSHQTLARKADPTRTYHRMVTLA